MKLLTLGKKLQKKLKILSSAKFSNTYLNIQKDFDELEFDAFLNSSKQRPTVVILVINQLNAQIFVL